MAPGPGAAEASPGRARRRPPRRGRHAPLTGQRSPSPRSPAGRRCNARSIHPATPTCTPAVLKATADHPTTAPPQASHHRSATGPWLPARKNANLHEQKNRQAPAKQGQRPGKDRLFRAHRGSKSFDVRFFFGSGGASAPRAGTAAIHAELGGQAPGPRPGTSGLSAGRTRPRKTRPPPARDQTADDDQFFNRSGSMRPVRHNSSRF